MLGRRLIIELLDIVCCIAIFSSCAALEETDLSVSIYLDSGEYALKSGIDPDENLISDANVFIYDSNSFLVEHIWAQFTGGGERMVVLEALTGVEYSLYVLCNTGYRVPEMTEAQLLDFKYYLSSPDAYSKGLPMAGVRKGIVPGKTKSVSIELERLMSKISLRIDRSKLNEGVDFFIQSARIGNCPRCVNPFAPSVISGHEETFATGLCKSDDNCYDLNSNNGKGVSDEISLFVFENPANVLDEETCPYIELQADYMSDKWYTDGKKFLVYRFYIREKDSYRLDRNCHYRVTVTPHEDGLLCEDSWRVDKSGLLSREEEYWMAISPEGSWEDGTFYPYYYQMATNSSMHFKISTSPARMEVRLREDLVEDEYADGRAEYIMDGDGKGFTVKSLNKNCLSMMELVPGEPLGEGAAEIIVIEISGSGVP